MAGNVEKNDQSYNVDFKHCRPFFMQEFRLPACPENIA